MTARKDYIMKQAGLLTIFTLIVLLVTVGTATAAQTPFSATLSGSNEVVPVNTTMQGIAKFHLNGSGNLDFKLVVTKIGSPVVAAHIHCGVVGVNGPVGVTLYPGPATTMNGMLAKGTITAPNAGNACGWGNVAAVVSAIQAGITYVNVHTAANLGGEIRGQIK